MEFKEQISQLSERINTYKDMLHSEDETKRSLILPFFMTLGYDIFNPSEFISEIKCDIGVKKGERVDYAILKDSKPIIIIECKHCGIKDLTPHLNQLYRYFNASKSTKFGILTNGIIYKFYTDFETSNIMDEEPFWEFDMSNIDNDDIELLKIFCKISLDIDSILKSVKERRYKKELEERLEQERKELEHKLGVLIRRELQSPSDDLVSFFIEKVCGKELSQELFVYFSEVVKRHFIDLTTKQPQVIENYDGNDNNKTTIIERSTNTIAHDCSKYAINGEGKFSKRGMVEAVVNRYVEQHPNITIKELKSLFDFNKDFKLKVIKYREEVGDLSRVFESRLPTNEVFYIDNQWGKSIQGGRFESFISHVNANIEGITIAKIE